MSDNFLSLSAAESYTGKSRSSLRRFVESITKPDDHPDRCFILPTPDEVERLHSDNHPFSWQIKTQLLDRKFPKRKEPAGSVGSETGQGSSPLLEKTIEMLQTELTEKNKQIAEFQARDRETNVLLKQSTEKLALLTEHQQKRDLEEDVRVVAVEANEVTSNGSYEASTFWQRLRRPIFSRQ